MSSIFFYDEILLRKLVESLSADRLSKYLEYTRDDQTKALQTYTWNTAISAAFYGPLQGLEVALRNAMHRELSRRFETEWFDNDEVGLDSYAVEQVNAVKSKLRRTRNNFEASDVVAALVFGFWVSLLGTGGHLDTGGQADYQMTLWRPALRKIFPFRHELTRKQAHVPLHHLRIFRNRIAHHEPIFQRDLASDYERILEVAGWISPATATWIKCHNRVPELLKQRNGWFKF